jgi:hypothetical protein
MGSINVAEANMDCGTCVFWKASGDGSGLCRANPPVVIDSQRIGPLPGDWIATGGWPSTRRQDWCGEWTPEGDEGEMLIGQPFPVES